MNDYDDALARKHGYEPHPSHQIHHMPWQGGYINFCLRCNCNQLDDYITQPCGAAS